MLSLSLEPVNALLFLQNLQRGRTFQILAWYTSKSRGLEIQGEWFSDKRKECESIYTWKDDTKTWLSR
jgi:hypothetical protein